jgi:DNA-binding CsgD family transcriptional regulator
MAAKHARKIDVKRAVKMRMQGQSYGQIAKAFGVTRQSVAYHLRPMTRMLGNTGILEAYQAHKSDLIDGVQLKLVMELLDEEKIKKASLGNVAYSVRQLNDILRLERDLSTSNVAVAHMEAIKTVEEADEEIAKITNTLDSKVINAQGQIEYKHDRSLELIQQEIDRIEKLHAVEVPDSVHKTSKTTTAYHS